MNLLAWSAPPALMPSRECSMRPGTTQPEGWAGLVGLAVLIFAAAGFVGALQDALDKIWQAPPRPSGCVGVPEGEAVLL